MSVTRTVDGLINRHNVFNGFHEQKLLVPNLKI